MIQGWCLSPARIHVQGAFGSWIVLPRVPAARPLRVTGDRLRRQDDEPRPACTCVQRYQCHCGLEDPVGSMRVRLDWVRSVRLCEGHFPGSRIGGTALRNLHAAPLIGAIRGDPGNLCDNSFVPARGFRSPAVVVQSAHTPGAARCVTGHVQRWTLPRTGLHGNIP